jgi:hypothetical protein
VDSISEQLVAAEQRLASVPELEHRLRQAEAEKAALAAELRSTAATLEAVLGSPSWRLTAPMRRLRQLARRRHRG